MKSLIGLFERKSTKPNNQPKALPPQEQQTRYLTHLQTDKNIYKPKETVYLRGFVLNAFNNAPVPKDRCTGLTVKLEIISPKGDKVTDVNLPAPQASCFHYSWIIPAEQAGGDYKFEVSYPNHAGFAFAQREFNIRVFNPPRLKTQLEFVKKGYGAGETAQAKLSVERAEGGYPEGAKVTAVARIDGSEVARNTFYVGADGKCLVSFVMPDEIDVGVGTLSCVIEDGGTVETASKTIPVILKAMNVNVYPEGGQLVVGIVSPFYIEAFTAVGDPADLTANIFYLEGEEEVVVGSVSTTHEGRGRGEFTPIADKEYHLRVTQPVGITKTVAFPKVEKEGVVLSALKKAYEYTEPIEVSLAASQEGTYTVQLWKRDAQVQSIEVKLEKGKLTETVAFKPDPNGTFYYDGVLRVTVLGGKDNLPLAERLVFRKSAGKLNIVVKPSKKNYTPGDKVELEIYAEDADGGRVREALFGITVTDDSVRQMTEKRKQPPRIGPMVYFENEVDHLDDAHVYLKDKNKEKADNAVDLLLGTQGWRRFIYVRSAEYLQNNQKRGERLFAIHEVKPSVLHASISPRRHVRKKEKESRAVAVDKRKKKAFADFEEEENDEVFAAPPMRANPLAFNEEPVDEEIQMEEDNNNNIIPLPLPPPAGAPHPPPPAAQPQPQQQLQQAQPPPPPLAAPMAAMAPPMLDELVPARSSSLKASKSMIPGAAMGMRAPPMARRRMEEPRLSLVVAIREYAHIVRPDRKTGDRVDFKETLYWNAGLVSDNNGKVTVNFSLNDSITSFRVMVDGVWETTISKSNLAYGLIGNSDFVFESKQPFYLEPKMPLEVTSGDVIKLPVVIVNNTAKDLKVTGKYESQHESLSIKNSEVNFGVAPEERLRQILDISVADHNGDVGLALSAEAGILLGRVHDKVTRTTRVMPRGFPYQIFAGNEIESNTSQQHEFTIPEGVIPTSITATGQVYFSPMSNMTEALKRLIQEPCGCFEQTSSTVYPLAMAQKYFQTHTDVDPSLITKADDILQRGYKRLVGFRCSKGGYDWFGSDPASEVLTAYGILEFTEISRVMTGVDAKMISETIEWILSRRDGSGKFKLNTRVLHTWDTQQDIADAYILYSLTSSGIKADVLSAELDSIKKRLGDSTDPYLLALLANICFNIGDNDLGTSICDKLTQSQDKEGGVTGAKTTITQSGGVSVTIETTSLCMLAWVKDKQSDWSKYANAGQKFLATKSQLGGYCNTQATVLAIEAIIANDIKNSSAKAPGTVTLVVDGEEYKSLAFGEPGAEHKPIEFGNFGEKFMNPGSHAIELRMYDGSKANYSFEVAYSAIVPDTDPECSVELTKVDLSNPVIAEGEGTEINITLTNKTKEYLPMTVAIIGLPGGLELRHEKMKELVKSEKLASYEVLGARRVVCYWRGVEPNQNISFCIDVVANVPGTYTGPASCAYLYYTNEYKHWVGGLEVDIKPK